MPPETATLATLTGLVFGFLGTLAVALSVAKNPGLGYQAVDGKKIYLAVILYPLAFRIGMILISLGFVLQAAPLIDSLVASAATERRTTP